MRAACRCAATLSAIAFAAFALLARSPASAQFVCTTTATDVACNNAGTATSQFVNTANGTNQNATTTNSGTANVFVSLTTGGGNATAINSGTNSTAIAARAMAGGTATVINSGSSNGLITAEGVDATVINSGSNSSTGRINAIANGGNAAVINSGQNAAISAVSEFGNGNVTVTNSGVSLGLIAAEAFGGGNATAVNSGRAGAFLLVGNNATLINSGSASRVTMQTGAGGAVVINSGTIDSTISATAIEFESGPDTLTNVVGGRVIGGIALLGVDDTVNFVGGNWLFTFTTLAAVHSGIPSTNALAAATINTNGAPFVVSGNTVAVLDATSFALADRVLTNFTGEVQQMLQGRFDGMYFGEGGGGSALAFAGAPPTPGLANEATQAFSGIPSVAMSYASDSRPLLGKAPAAAAPYYDTTVWASGFGGERKQNSDGVVLPATDIAYGGALGVDRAFGPNLRLGAFAGGGASREDVELSVQSINSTYAFGGGYGRFDWTTQYLDLSLYGGGINNSSTRQVANNTMSSGLEVATANYGGWFINPAVTYGYRIPLKDLLVTPRLSLRYVGGSLDGYSESGSEQDLSVGRRAINDLEERAELEFSTLKPVSWGGAVKSTIGVGAIGLERLGDQTIDTVLLGQNLSFVTPGQASAVGGVLDASIQYRPASNVSLFISTEGTAMSDRSYSGAATGGARVSF